MNPDIVGHAAVLIKFFSITNSIPFNSRNFKASQIKAMISARLNGVRSFYLFDTGV